MTRIRPTPWICELCKLPETKQEPVQVFRSHVPTGRHWTPDDRLVLHTHCVGQLKRFIKQLNSGKGSYVRFIFDNVTKQV